MKKNTCGLLFLLILTTAGQIYAQNETASHPNLGREATPLTAISLTPSPLPNVEIELSDKPITGDKADAPREKKEKKVVKKEKEKATSDAKEKQTQPKTAPHLKPETVVKKRVIAPIPLTVINQSPEKLTEEVSLATVLGQTHDVFDFEVAGFYLGQTPTDVIQVAKEKGFVITKTQDKLPIYFTAYFTHLCTNQGTTRPHELRDCVRQLGALNEATYIAEMWLERFTTGETVQILFTSPATDNYAYKIYYKNKGDNSLGTTRMDLAAKFRRKNQFWTKMFETYGLPDNADKYIWGNPQKAYMQAMMQGANYDAYILLENVDAPFEDEAASAEYAKDFEYADPFFFNE